MRWFSFCFCLSVILNTGLNLCVAQTPFDELARHIPSSANAVAFVNVEKLMTSPIAVRDKWSEARENAFVSGLSMLPPDAKQAVMAMQVDLQMWVPLWEAALVELDHEPVIATIAAMTGGSPDKIMGREVVGLPEDAFVVKFGKTTAAFMAPANRQFIARWMREIDVRKAPELSPYLSEGLHFVSDLGTPLILALDLEDSISAEDIQAGLEQAKDLLAKHKMDAAATAKAVAGIRGVTLGITFDQKPYGKIKVDFRDELKLAPEAAKAALLHALKNHGAMIDEFEDWKPSVEGKQLALSGYLTTSGMRRISSLFDRPPSLKAKAIDPQNQSANKQQVMQKSSQAYFKRIVELLDDLKDEKKGNTSYTMAQLGVWMDKYAKKIDQLSVLNVDPELVEYGAHAADTLRAAYNAIRTGAARSRVRQVNTPMQYNYYTQANTYGFTYRDGFFGGGYTPVGSYGTVSVPDRAAYQHERTRVKAEERVTSANSARDLIQQLQMDTAQIRRKMTQKYQVDF